MRPLLVEALRRLKLLRTALTARRNAPRMVSPPSLSLYSETPASAKGPGVPLMAGLVVDAECGCELVAGHVLVGRGPADEANRP